MVGMTCMEKKLEQTDLFSTLHILNPKSKSRQ